MLRTQLRAGPFSGLLLSLLAAGFLTFVQLADALVDEWKPEYDKRTGITLRVPYGPRVMRDEGTGRADVRFEHQRIVIPRGTVLNADSTADRTALAFETRRRPPAMVRTIGVFVVFFTLCLAVTTYLRSFGQNRLRLLRVQVGVFVLFGLVIALAKGFLLFTSLPAYWVPVAAVPLWVATSFGRRSAFVIAMVLAFITASLLRFDLMLLCVVLTRGVTATLLYVDRKRSRYMVISGLLGGAAAAALYAAVMIAVEGRYELLADLLPPSQSDLLAIIGGGLLGGLLAAALRGPAARLLGSVSRDRLLDLTDLEQPLLQKMAKEAPGTWEHCRAMANLAEQASSAIGADGLLTRVGAYYHDLGKTVQSKYFVENLEPDEPSPHDDLEPDVSADAIMAHVVLGTKILRDGGIPEPVVEFAYTHHGTQAVEYFWNKCTQQGNPKGLDKSAFRYPGMKPQTKETAILMLVDSIEAASRTIDPPNREQFEAMIQRVVFTKLKAGQIGDSGLDIDDLRIIITRMADTLVNMHHHRIKYPWQIERAEEFGVPREAVAQPQIELHGHATVTMPPSAADDLPQVESRISSHSMDSSSLRQEPHGVAFDEVGDTGDAESLSESSAASEPSPASEPPSKPSHPSPPALPTPRPSDRMPPLPPPSPETSIPPSDPALRPSSSERSGTRGQNR